LYADSGFMRVSNLLTMNNLPFAKCGVTKDLF
jgi:hypothetical protein